MSATHTSSTDILEPKPPGALSALVILLCGLMIIFSIGQGSWRDWLPETWRGFQETFSSINANNAVLAEAAPEVEPDVVPVPNEVLSPRMNAVLEHVTRRYRVAATTLRPIFTAAQSTARQRGLDPLLIVAIIGIESGFNPYSESPFGAQGLMQIIPRFHQDKVPEGAGEQAFLDPVLNVRIGTQVLQEAIRMRGSLEAGLQQYGGSSDPELSYAARVLAEKSRLEQVPVRQPKVNA